jgi:hypothetical protein
MAPLSVADVRCRDERCLPVSTRRPRRGANKRPVAVIKKHAPRRRHWNHWSFPAHKLGVQKGCAAAARMVSDVCRTEGVSPSKNPLRGNRRGLALAGMSAR